ncbi:hypothetical protein PAAG_02809 [Paracoccidioides lutzii Pb01]|uniref:Uncharacterized protein n=1 Tax=Paracoccidioides lutzii (strain ATCC MYA-826 / Pb01) TaxID=502779 RepID=C1GWB4_PARBA|nr:hypothetical protein PAAG_02809 [Paracoccidioides lutzii Pb01]EEH40833.2 hypothetical protein PAAG_02809 [Paracoccidioides lutzii Pb01]
MVDEMAELSSDRQMSRAALLQARKRDRYGYKSQILETLRDEDCITPMQDVELIAEGPAVNLTVTARNQLDTIERNTVRQAASSVQASRLKSASTRKTASSTIRNSRQLIRLYQP